jgi:hypothetical protein
MTHGMLLHVILLAALAISSTHGGDSGSSETPSNTPIRVWVDRGFYIPGETEILEDIVANSSGRLTVNPYNNSAGEQHAQCLRH